MSSNRVKRLLRRIENLRGSKKQRIITGSDDEGGKCSSSIWTPKSLGDFPSNNIYNSVSRSPPAELFRKDLISAMKLPDSEPLASDDYWIISDQWKQEWERGVQVPVNPEALPEPSVRVMRKKDKLADFKLPKRLVRMTADDSFYTNESHQMSDAASLAEQVCRYDLDDCDLHWLTMTNNYRTDMGLPAIEEDAMENIIEELESKCYTNMQQTIHSEAVLGIEYDETVICDVCRSPDSEEGNEMVFCDSCDICVHQACYGITNIPDGSWLCRTCSLTVKPTCILCPNTGGAMKATRSGQKWAHVSCALWIPEVSIGCVEKMEPITKIAHIPPSRWALICCLCRERVGACIQCSVKSCKTAYHVTCGFHNGLEMKAIVEDENDEDGVKLRSYCPKHSMDKDSSVSSDSEGEDGSSSVKLKEISSEDKATARARRLRQIEALFFKYVKISEVAGRCHCAVELVQFVYYYWKLKRSAGFNGPLLSPRSGESGSLSQVQEDGLFARMKMFVHLRQDLERVRNLCYMVSRREKLSRSWTRMREQIFHKQVSVMTDTSLQLTSDEKRSVVHACHGRNIYDRLYSNNPSCCASSKVTRLIGTVAQDGSKLSNNLNVLIKGSRKQIGNSGGKLSNPYARTYFLNGSSGRSRRKSGNSTDVGDTKLWPDRSCGIDGAVNVLDGGFSHSQDTVADAKNDAMTAGKESDLGETMTESVRMAVKSKQYPLQLQYQQQKHFTRSASHKIEDLGSITTTGEHKDGVSGVRLDQTPNRNGDVCGVCESFRSADKKTLELFDSSESISEDAKDDTKYLCVKENMERLAIDVGSPPNNSSERRFGEDDESETSICIQRHHHRKSKQRFRNLRSPTEKTPPKESGGGGRTVANNSPTLESPPFRDKLRQESAKIHESLFSISLKGSLAGYRIPKKLRSESESDSKHDEVIEQPQQESARTQSQPQEQMHQNHVSCWKEQATPLVVCASVAANNPSPPRPAPPPLQLQSPMWNSNSRPLPLLPTPPIPRLALSSYPDRRLTRRDKSLYVSSSNPVMSPTSQVNGRDDNGCSGRLVIKLRKDPNYPESHRWRRDGDVADSGVYNFNCEQSDVRQKHIRLKLNTRFDHRRRHHGRDRSNHQSSQRSHSPLSCRSSDSRSFSRHNSSKYSMRSRTSLSDSSSCGHNFSSNIS